MGKSVLSVGIDIGTTTSQVVFSRLLVKNMAAPFTVPRVEIAEKEIVYRGPVHKTPLLSSSAIDGEALARLVAAEFAAAGFTPGDTETGAVIITGEAARKENARAVQQALSQYAGEFVVATAGPDLEALIAGKGSGASRYSRQNSCAVANLDIGGGTTNIAVVDCGELVCTGCRDVGGHQVTVDGAGQIAYVSEKLAPVLRQLDLPLAPGMRTEEAALARLAAALNDVLEQAMGLAPKTPLARQMETAGASSLPDRLDFDAVCFSGGVADCMAPGPAPFAYGDIGVLLGAAIARGRLAHTVQVVRPEETIRSTVIGAGCHTISVTGSTITYNCDVLPMKNVPVLCFAPEEEARVQAGDGDFLQQRMRWFLQQCAGEDVVLYFKTPANLRYQQLQDLATGVARGADGVLVPGRPVLVALRGDMAMALGQQVNSRLRGARPVVCVDGVLAAQGDYMDLGKPLLDGMALQVAVKTLLYG